MTLLAGLAIIAFAVYALLRRVEVRLVLFLSAMALGVLAGHPEAIVSKFLATFSNEQFVIPLCTAMGFAQVLKFTGCDRHLVQMLVRPIQYVRFLLIPGAVVVAFLVNIPVVSQTSTAVVVGTVLVPLLLASRISPLTIGSALLLGASLGGELLNYGAPELRTVTTTLDVGPNVCVARIGPLLAIQLALTVAVFWPLSYYAEKRYASTHPEEQADLAIPDFRVNYLKALIPLVPLVLLFVANPPLEWLKIPADWLRDSGKDQYVGSRLIGLAMMVGVAASALVSPSSIGGTAQAFFEGAGYGFTHIISLIVTASCFGEGVRLIGLADVLQNVIGDRRDTLMLLAGGFPMAFAWVCGSGMATTQSVFKFFVTPAQAAGVDPVHVGAVISIAAAAGRTISPVAAVNLMVASMTRTSPFEIAWRLALPVLIGMIGVLAAAMFIAAS